MGKIIETKRFRLKEIEASDIKHIYRGLSNPIVTKHYAVHFPSLEATKKQMDWYANLQKNGTGMWWGIYAKFDGAFCGAGGYNGLEKEHQKAEIGFWVLPEYWGKGIMTEVMPRLFQAGFEDLNLNRIEGFVESDNEKCKRGLAKINFQYEGTMHQCERKKDRFIDVDFYALLKENFLLA